MPRKTKGVSSSGARKGSNMTSNERDVHDLHGQVTFEGILPCYPQNADILVKYSCSKTFSPSRQDWVGLFQTGWGTTEDCLIHVSVPPKQHGRKKVKSCSVAFHSNQLQAISVQGQTFQFLFVTRGNHVVGVSRTFSITVPDCDSQTGSSTSILTLSDRSSFSLVGSNDSVDTQGFEDLSGSAEDIPPICLPEPDRKLSSSLLLSRLFGSSPAMDASPEIPHPVNEERNRESRQPQPVPLDNKCSSESDTISTGSSSCPIMVSQDNSTLAGDFKETKSFLEKLHFVDQHPIVQEYENNKERSVVPYVPLFRISKSTKPMNLENTPNNVASIPKSLIRYTHPSSAWLQLEMMPCCGLCSVARSLMEVFRRQIVLGKEELKERQLELICLRKSLENKDEQIAKYKRDEQKHKQTEDTIEDVLSQITLLKDDINKLVGQNAGLENENIQLKSDVVSCREKLAQSEARNTSTEGQLNDILFSLSLKGHSNVIDFTGKNINLSEINGEPTEIEGWQVYKNKRCGRLLAVINQQEKKIEAQQTALSEKNEVLSKLQAELVNTQELLESGNSYTRRKEDELKELKESLRLSQKREEYTVRALANAETEMTQYKYESETREHYLLKQIHEMKASVPKKSTNAMMAFTNRLVSNGLASVPSVCASLCPSYSKDCAKPTKLASSSANTSHTPDTVSWENEKVPTVKQPKISSKKKDGKRSSKEASVSGGNPHSKGISHSRRSVFPDTCPVCGISFASAVDSRVVDEHLAFHDIYRV